MKVYPHWQNLSSKLNNSSGNRLALLQDLKERYREWRVEINNIEGTNKEDIISLAESYNTYKNYIQKEKFDEFDRRGRLQSTVLEEFMFHLFRGLVEEVVEGEILYENNSQRLDSFSNSKTEEGITLEQKESKYLGKGDKTIESISLDNLMEEECLDINASKTNHDFVIGREISIDEDRFYLDPNEGNEKVIIPAVIIECKEYFDKTMTRRAIEEAAGMTNNLTYKPHFYLVSEYIKVADLDLMAGSDISNMYVLRKQQQRDLQIRRDDPDWPSNRNDIDPELVWHLFQSVKKFLEEDSREEIITKGRYY